jgi:hypothetical protein
MRLNTLGLLSVLAFTGCGSCGDQKEVDSSMLQSTPLVTPTPGPECNVTQANLDERKVPYKFKAEGDFGKIDTETDIECLKGKELEKDPKYSSLLRRFRLEATRQIGKVKQANGYCSLPMKFPAAEDQRLGDSLLEISQELDNLMRDIGCTRSASFQVDLGRSMCQAVEAPLVNEYSEIPIDKEGRVERALKPVVAKFNKTCNQAQGGDFSRGLLSTDRRAFDNLLLERGKALQASVSEGILKKAEDKWKSRCAEGQETPLTSLQREQFLSSFLLADAILEYGIFECTGVGDNYAGTWLYQDRVCGITTMCIQNDGAVANAEGRIPGHHVQVALDGSIYDSKDGKNK